MSSIQRWFKDFSEPREASLTTGHSLSDAPQPDSTSSSSKSGSNCSAVMPELPRPVQKMVDSKVVKFTAYLIDFCWFVWFVVVAVCLVSLSNADFSDSSPTVGSNKANSTSTAGSNKANSTSTASSSRTTKLNVEVGSANVPFKHAVIPTFDDIISKRTIDMAPSAFANAISDAVDKYAQYDLRFGTKSHINELYIPWDYDEDLTYQSVFEIKNVKTNVLFSTRWTNQTWGTHLIVSEDLDAVSMAATVNITFTHVADCTIKLSVGSFVLAKVDGTLTFNGTLDGDVKVKFSDLEFHASGNEAWRFEAGTESTVNFHVSAVNLVDTEFQGCTVSGYDLCEAGAVTLKDLFKDESNANSLDKQIEKEVKSQIDDYLGDTFEYTFEDSRIDFLCDYLECDSLNELKKIGESYFMSVFH
mmetsp:Transcript_71666/g.202611  ORF Transcript_71666/g.202611 Transcript_71666/m.202611 type:complete len:416 (-) Transcript_71666:672-1919(-)